jgi:methylated-DNA-[protein]-cysteine S-methyltransferase
LAEFVLALAEFVLASRPREGRLCKGRPRKGRLCKDREMNTTLPMSDRCDLFPQEHGWSAIARSKLGWLVVTAGNAGVQHVHFDLPTRDLAEAASLAKRPTVGGEDLFAEDQVYALVMDVVQRLQRYADGEWVEFHDVTLDEHALTIFQLRVRTACRSIPWGETRSYAELAEAAGSPRASRAVGNVMARNPLPLIVPCHRVLGSQGRLGGFSSRQGLTMKRRLLELESAR